MIISSEFSDLLQGFSIDVNSTAIPVQNTIGDEDALQKFIRACDEKQLDKFPLIFILVAKTTGQHILRSKRKIVIMSQTNPDWLGKDRTHNSFRRVIKPIYDKLIPIIEKSSSFKIIGDRKTAITYEDKPNYGVINGAIQKTSQSAVSDYIDARIVELELEFNDKNC